MSSFRRLRRRRIALALLPAAAVTSMTVLPPAATGGSATSSKLETSKRGKVRPGARVTVRGQFPPDSASQPATQAQPTPEGEEQAVPEGTASNRVRIEFRPAGKQHWRAVRSTRTGPEGRYSERVKVRRSGRFRAVHADGRRTGAKLVRVRAKLRAKVGRRHAKLGQRVPIRGRVAPSGSRRAIVVRIGGDRLRTRTRRDGKFKVRWRPSRAGTYKAAVRARSDKLAAGTKKRAGRATVYRPAQASWYGPGFYGNRTACGQTLTTSTVGVAHKTMPCGTKLKLKHGSRTVSVRVIDRGPYHGNREFDLTGATKEKLGFGSTGVVYASK